MGNDLDPNLFYWYLAHRHKRKSNRSQVSVPKGGTHTIATVRGQRGHIDFVQVVLATNTTLHLVITVDDQVIFDYTHDQIIGDGEGKLAIPLLYGEAAPFGATRTTAGYYGIMWNGKSEAVQFEREMDVEVVNKDTAAKNLVGFYALYAITTLEKIRKL